MTDIVTGMDVVTRNIKNYILHETEENGLLDDLETVILTYHYDEPIDPPAVWIVEHPTIAYGQNNLSHLQKLQTTFEFVCIEYDDDLEIAQMKGENLATRVAASILRNFNQITTREEDPVRIFDRVNFNALYPVGEVAVVGKAEKVPATSVVFDFIHTIDWLKCRRP